MGERFFRLDADFSWHPKTLELERILAYPGAGGFVVYLWAWVALLRPNGDLTGMDAGAISAAARWPGDADTFVNALRVCGGNRAGFLELVDGHLVLHDWLEKQTYFAAAEKRQGERNRKRVQRMSQQCPTDERDNAGTLSQDCPTPEKKREDQRREITPPTPQGANDGFEEFWQLYPKRVGKKAAYKVWARLKLDAPLRTRIYTAINAQLQWEQWSREGGRFIPNPATWLSQGRWDDEEHKREQSASSGTAKFKVFMEEHTR